jgi:hypothetical protein
MIMSTFTPPPINPERANKFQQMALGSWLAPIIAIVINVMLIMSQGSKPTGANPAQMVIGPLFILGGLALGIVALFGIRNHGAKRILAPAIVGISLNIFLIIAAALPAFASGKRQARIISANRSSAATLVKNDKLRFSISIPEGFRDFSEGRTKPTIEHMFIRDIPGTEGARLGISIERLGGILPRGEPMRIEDIRKKMPAGAATELVSKKWGGMEVEAILVVIQQNEERVVVCTTQVPLVPFAIQLSVVGPESMRAEVEQLVAGLLASLQGQTNW